MRDKKEKPISALLILVMILCLVGCGNAVPAFNDNDLDNNTKEVADMIEEGASLDEIIDKAEGDMEPDVTPEPTATAAPTMAPTAAPTMAPTPEPTTAPTPAPTATPTMAPTPAPTMAPTPAPTMAPTPEPTPEATPEPTPEPMPVHEHDWKEHTATAQVWVPNIVAVDDYKTQYVVVGCNYICGCGFESSCTTVAERDAFGEHFKECFRAGNASNFTAHDVYGEETVKVGSHEEDHGYYETSTYVDYYYCDCGATK